MNLLFILCMLCVPIHAMQNCCTAEHSPIERAIINSDFKKINRLLNDPENAPIIVNQSVSLAKAVSVKRKHEVDNPFSSKISTNKSLTLGMAQLCIGFFGGILFFSNMFRECDTGDIDATTNGFGMAASLVALYHGGKSVLDPIFQWSENDRLAKAMAVEQLLKRKAFRIESPES